MIVIDKAIDRRVCPVSSVPFSGNQQIEISAYEKSDNTTILDVCCTSLDYARSSDCDNITMLNVCITPLDYTKPSDSEHLTIPPPHIESIESVCNNASNGLSDVVKFEDETTMCESDNEFLAKSCHERSNLDIQEHNDDRKDADSNGHFVDVGEEDELLKRDVKSLHGSVSQENIKSIHDRSIEENVAAIIDDLSFQENVESTAEPSFGENMKSLADPFIQEGMPSMADPSIQGNEKSSQTPSVQGNMASMSYPSNQENVKSMANPSLEENEEMDHVVDNSGGECQAHQRLQSNSDDDECKIRFSGALPYSGMLTYSGQIPHSGNLSYRSDSSTSTRSFAFPIISREWSFNSPRKIGPPDVSFFKRRQRWRCACCCWCKEPTTLFD